MAYSETTWQNGITPINETNLNKIENELENLENNKIDNIFGAGNYLNSINNRVYVDNVNGNDENIGTRINPFKSLIPVINLINKGLLKIDIFLRSGQTFNLPFDSSRGYATFNACTLHIGTYDGTDKAIITWNKENDTDTNLVFYNCHCNFNNIKFTKIGYEMYFDGGSNVMFNCEFDCKYTLWGCASRIQNSIVKTAKFRICNVWLEGTASPANNVEIGCIDAINSQITCYRCKFHPEWKINHDNQSTVGFNAFGCYIYIYGVTQIMMDEQPLVSQFLYWAGCYISLASGPTKSSNTYSFTTNSTLSASKMLSNTTRYNTLKDSCTNIDLTDGSEVPQ